MLENNCRVCGFHTETPIRDEDNNATYEICSCCGVEFGYEDYTKESTLKYREKWINSSCEWFESKLKPQDWNLDEQMKNINSEFL